LDQVIIEHRFLGRGEERQKREKQTGDPNEVHGGNWNGAIGRVQDTAVTAQAGVLAPKDGTASTRQLFEKLSATRRCVLNASRCR
jgi:hypothetical protein